MRVDVGGEEREVGKVIEERGKEEGKGEVKLPKDSADDGEAASDGLGEEPVS